jgi:hypothetical protein
MRFRKLFPVLTIAMAVALGACAEEGAEDEEMTADTLEMAPAPEPAPMPADTMIMPGDTVMMIDTSGQM